MTFLQLRMLLWKNFILRKRQKVRCVVEVIWPLFLFLILMWVRTRGLKEHVPECHFDPKAMPSAGQLPFLLSFFCTFNNTCYQTARSHQGHPDSYNSSFLKNLLRSSSELMDIINSSNSSNSSVGVGKISSSDVQSLLEAHIDLQHLSLPYLLALRHNPREVLCDKSLQSKLILLEDSAVVARVQHALCHADNFSITNILQPDFEAVLQELTNAVETNLGHGLNWAQWRQLSSLLRQAAADVAALDAYKTLLDRVAYLGKEYRLMNSDLEAHNMSSMYSIFMLLQKVICSRDWATNEIGSSKQDKASRFDTLREQLRDMSSNAVVAYVYDNDTSPFCNAVFESLENNTITRILWLQIKPMYRGKILYAPETVATRRVMQRVNETFDSILALKSTIEGVLNQTVRPMKNLLSDTDNLRFLKSFLDTSLGQRLLQLLVNNTITNSFFDEDNAWRENDVKNFTDRFFDERNARERTETLDMIDSAHETAVKVLECFETNKIMGFSTEREATKLGMQLLSVKKLWAVVSFMDSADNASDANLSPFVTYKIRMDSNSVDETTQIEDRLPRPGPRRRPSIDLKYITNGFAYLQVSVEEITLLLQVPCFAT